MSQNVLSSRRCRSPLTIAWAWAATAQRRTGMSFKSRSCSGTSMAAGWTSVMLSRYAATSPTGSRPLDFSRAANLGRRSTAVSSPRSSSVPKREKVRSSAWSRKEAGGPCQSRPEIRTLVSATTLAGASFVAAGLHLRLDLVHGHRFIGLSAQGGDHAAENRKRFVESYFPLNQAADAGRLEQSPAGRPPDNGRRQIYGDVYSHGEIRACPMKLFLPRLINAGWTKAPRTPHVWIYRSFFLR